MLDVNRSNLKYIEIFPVITISTKQIITTDQSLNFNNCSYDTIPTPIEGGIKMAFPL
jgi:hypothetical protein